jgi:Cu-Zn family superoxide dismutase
MIPRLPLTVALLAPVLAFAAPTAVAELKDAAGKPVGTARFTSTAGGLEVKVRVTGLPPGPHGFHVHAVGLCEGPDFKSAAGHFNPAGKQHGLENPQGHHGGDLPNLVVYGNGTGEATATLAGLTLGDGEASLFHAGGTSVVIHAAEDDGKTDPSGNSGARIACGVVAQGK